MTWTKVRHVFNWANTQAPLDLALITCNCLTLSSQPSEAAAVIISILQVRQEAQRDPRFLQLSTPRTVCWTPSPSGGVFLSMARVESCMCETCYTGEGVFPRDEAGLTEGKHDHCGEGMLRMPGAFLASAQLPREHSSPLLWWNIETGQTEWTLLISTFQPFFSSEQFCFLKIPVYFYMRLSDVISWNVSYPRQFGCEWSWSTYWIGGWLLWWAVLAAHSHSHPFFSANRNQVCLSGGRRGLELQETRQSPKTRKWIVMSLHQSLNFILIW